MRHTANFLSVKKWIIIAGAILAALILFTPHHAHGFGYGWKINSFNTEITLDENSGALIKETIVADYTNEEHHGLYRMIPIRYRDNYSQNFNLRVNVISVKDENGKDWWYETSREGEYLKVQAGDPNGYLNKPSTFEITYKVQRAVSNQFSDHTEFYWNATGDEWLVPIDNAQVLINFPPSIPTNDVKATCYTGTFGSTAHNCTYNVTQNSIIYETTTALNAQEGLTIVAGFPKGYIKSEPFLQTLFWILMDNWGYLIPVLTFLILFYLWWTRGRDPQSGKTTIMPYYTPPENLSPAEVGTILDESVDMRDISSTVIDLAVRGYIKIKELKEKILFFDSNDFEFELVKDYKEDATLKEHEIKVLDAVFTNGNTKKLSSLKYKFYEKLPAIRNQIYKEIVDRKYFLISPDKIRNTYYGIGGGLIALLIFTAGFFFQFISLGIGLLVSGILLIIFARFMPAKTKEGVEAYYKVKGLEEFIRTAETDRIKWQEKENMFERLLPYAMAFGIADKWSNAFKDIYKTAPNWYSSTDPNFMNNFTTGYFLGRLNSLQTGMNTTFAASPRSSGRSGSAWGGSSGFGGGFSGGGFGGGGGGSW